MKITLRGTSVQSKLISKSLSLTEKDSYRPLWLKTTAQLIIGFKCEDYDTEDYGLMMYHRNRLIKAYEKVGYQKQPNGMGVGVIGVAELNFLQPTHNKQDFTVDEKYNSVIKAFGTKLNDYWNAKAKEIQSLRQSGVIEFEPDSLWIQCDQCNKWRRMPSGTVKKNIPEKWFCPMNKDDKHKRCEDEEEKEEKDEILKSKGSTYKKIKPQRQTSVKTPQKLQDTPIQGQETNPPSGIVEPSTSRINRPSTSGSDSVLKVKLPMKENSSVSRKRSLFQTNQNSSIESSLEDGQTVIKVSKPNGKNWNTIDSTLDGNLSMESRPSVSLTIQADSSGASTLNMAQNLIKKNNEKSENVIQSVKSSGKSQSVATHLPKAAASRNEISAPPATCGYRMARPNLHNQMKENPGVIDVEKEDSQGEMKPVDFYKEKIEELKTKLNLKTRILDETEENLRKFQYNVHHLLSLIVPGKVVGDVSEIERTVEEMIKLHESESISYFEVKDVKKKPPTSFVPSSSSNEFKTKDNQCSVS